MKKVCEFFYPALKFLWIFPFFRDYPSFSLNMENPRAEKKEEEEEKNLLSQLAGRGLLAGTSQKSTNLVPVFFH